MAHSTLGDVACYLRGARLQMASHWKSGQYFVHLSRGGVLKAVGIADTWEQALDAAVADFEMKIEEKAS